MSLTKKVVFGVGGVGVVALLGGLLLGTNMIPYLRTAKDEAREAVEDTISPEYQLKTARNMLANDLEPEISRMKKAVAAARVDLREGESDLKALAERIAEDRSQIMTRTEQLDSDKTTFVINDVSYTDTELRDDLEKRFARFKTVEQTLKSKDQLIAAKRNALAKNEEKVVELLQAREELKLHIEELEARLSAVEASETIAESEFDDSQLRRINELIGRVEHKIEVREEAAAIEGQSTDLIPVETTPNRSIEDEVNAYFGNSKDTGNVAETETVEEEANN